MAKRNDTIFAEWRRGATLTGLAAKHKISRQVVGRIIASFHPELEEDTDRALYRGELWRLYDEMGEVFAAPGWKMSPNGGAAYGPDGEPAVDTNAKIQAGELRLKVLESLRKLDARDKPQQRHLTIAVDLAEQQKDAALAAVAAKREAELREIETARREVEQARKAPVVQGEVLRELAAPAEQDRQRRGESA